MRALLAIIGAVAGLSLASGSHELLGMALGVFAGLATGEFRVLRGKLQTLEGELATLRKSIALQRQHEIAARQLTRAAEPTTTPSSTAASSAEHPTSARPSSASAWEPYAVASPATGMARGAQGAATTGGAPDPTSAPSASTGTARPTGTTGPAAATASKGATGPTGATAPSGWAAATASATPRVNRTVQPHPEDPIDAAIRIVRDYFTGGNTLVRVGIIILFFGVAFLLRYAAEHSHVPIEFRLSGVALSAIVLLVLGWRLRIRRAGYALALQGGAVGILYLTVFAGMKVYSVLPPGAAFVLLVVIAAFSAALAVLQNSQSFAVLAVSGGFLAPILTSTGHGDHIVLFSYYAILNAGILAMAWFKAWRPLNVLGFLFTFVIGTAWGVLRYEPRLFATTEPFLILFFLFYVALAILFASRQPPALRGYVDGTLVFGTPLVAFGLQSALLHDRRFELAFSALSVSALYLMIATVLHRTRQPSQRLLVGSFMALGVLFLTLAVPLALDGRWTSATWALEGAALVWIGCRQDRRLPRAFGALLQIAGGVIFLFDIDAPHGTTPILNSAFLGGAMVSAASVFAAAILERHRERLVAGEVALAPLLFCWGLLWWLFSGLTEIDRQVPSLWRNASGLLLMAATALISSTLVQRAGIRFARYSANGLLPAMMVYAALAALELAHPFANGGWVAWPLAFAVFYFVCRRHEGEPESALANALHVGSMWLLTALVSWEVSWAINEGVSGGGSWPAIAWALVPAICLFALPKLTDRIHWPLQTHRQAYLGIGAVGLAFYLAVWSVKTNVTLPGNPFPLPFLPVLNPLDLAELFVLMVLLRFWLYVRSAHSDEGSMLPERPVFAALALLAFIWCNAALLRSFHHLAHVPWQLDALVHSNLVETGLSIFWTVIALVTMLMATRSATRIVWLSGAGLLGVVIAKLFLVDLSHVGTVERIVSFVGVGLLMLIIGYFSPLPPALEQAEATSA